MGRPWWQKALWIGTGAAAGAASLYVLWYGTPATSCPSASPADGNAATNKQETICEAEGHADPPQLQQPVSCKVPELQGALSSPTPPPTPSVTQHAPRSHASHAAGQQAKRVAMPADAAITGGCTGQQCIAELSAASTPQFAAESSTAKPAAIHMADDGISAACDTGSMPSTVTASSPSDQGGQPCSMRCQGVNGPPQVGPPDASTQAADAAQMEPPPVHITAAATTGNGRNSDSTSQGSPQTQLQVSPGMQQQPAMQADNSQQQGSWQEQGQQPHQLPQGHRERAGQANSTSHSAQHQQPQQAWLQRAAARQQESHTEPHAEQQAQLLLTGSQPFVPQRSSQHPDGAHIMQVQQQPLQQWPMLQQVPSGVHAHSSTQQAGVQAVAEARPHRSFNTARHAPSLDATVASAAVTRSLVAQYDISIAGSSAAALHSQLQQVETTSGCRTAAAAGTDVISTSQSTVQAVDERAGQGVSTLAADCAALCVQHCAKIQDAVVHETTVLDIGCGTGGTCFELAGSFSHVLGIDGDVLNITAAKELKSHGKLCFSHTASDAGARHADADQQEASQALQQQQGVCVALVPPNIDRDRVRFWHCPLPQLPPKLQPVDAVLVEDVDGHLGPGLQRVCQQLPALLNSDGVCVVVLGASGHAQADHTSLEEVKHWLDEAGLFFKEEVELRFKSGSSEQIAQAGVWLQPAC